MIEKIMRSLIYKADNEMELVRENILKYRGFQLIPRDWNDVLNLKEIDKEFSQGGLHSFKMLRKHCESVENAILRLDRLERYEKEELHTKNDFSKLIRDYIEDRKKESFKNIMLEAIDISRNKPEEGRYRKKEEELAGIQDACSFVIPKLVDFNQVLGVDTIFSTCSIKVLISL